ncbi:hypothetical protein GG344DRAFT_70109 [Lentinula edodes]|nr:hypothetical protein GG344DRAFT_70109 [Lentinula edodes]
MYGEVNKETWTLSWNDSVEWRGAKGRGGGSSGKEVCGTFEVFSGIHGRGLRRSGAMLESLWAKEFGLNLITMSSPSSNAVTGAPNPVLPPVSSLPHPDFTERIVDAAIDELASTLEEPPLGVSLARYIVDDPLWPLLAAAGLPCSFCVRGKKEANCSVVPHLARCSNCDDKKPCVLGRLARFRYFSLFARRFLEVHGDPGQRTRLALPSEQWRNIAAKVKASTNSTVTLMELNALDEQDQWELDCLELGEFRRQQPQLPRPLTTSSLPSPLPSVIPTPRALAKKRKRSVRQEEGGPSSRKRAVGAAPGFEVSPEVHDRKCKRSAGESRDAEVPDYRRVVLVLRPPPCRYLWFGPFVWWSCRGGRALLSSFGGNREHRSSSFTISGSLLWSPGSSKIQFAWFVEPVYSPGAVGTSRSPDVLQPFPRARATAALRAENETLQAEVADLRKLLETSWAETSTLTSLLRDTTTSLDDRNKDLEDVAADRLEYSRVLAQFRAIEAELPEAPLEDALTWFHLAVAQVDSYREVAIRQKHELSELREQVDKEQKRSFEAHKELDAANARAIRIRDRLEDLEETIHRYRARAHVAEELIRKYPEDEGLYEVDLPSLSSLQNKLTASEAMVRRLATFAHRLYSADPANLLHHHNMYVGGLIKAIITLLSHSLLHPPERMRTVVELALEYLSQGRLTHGELHLRLTSSLLYYYSNTADRVDGLYQDMLTYSRFSSNTVFLTAAQHAGYVEARPDSLEPPLHCRLFSFDHPIPLPQSPISDHIPAVPMMDAVILMWEDMISTYMREVLGYPASPDRVSSPVNVPGSNDPLPTASPLVASDPHPVLDASEPVSQGAPLFLPGSLSPTSPRPPSPIPSSSRVPHVPHEIVDLTMDDAEDLYESQEEFLARTGGAMTVKQENTESESEVLWNCRVRGKVEQLSRIVPPHASLSQMEVPGKEMEQLRSSGREVVEREMEDCRVLDQFPALDEALPGALGQSLSERFRKVQEDLQIATRERRVTVEKLIASTRKNSRLTTTLLHQQGLVDESNALATRQRRLVEELQEEVHRVCGRAVFVEQMLKEYPDEGYYEVVLPPLSQLEGDLNKAREDLRRVATFAHRLYRCDPATVLHHHHCYFGAIIEAVVAFLHRGLDSDDLDVIVHNFRLALDYVQAARGVHGDMYMRSISSIQWFFNNAVDEDEGLYPKALGGGKTSFLPSPVSTS